MIELTEGNVLEADAEALVNTVNCVGVMGKGIALQFKQKYPLNFEEYARACEKGELQPGRMLVHRTGMMMNPQYIINFPTKRHWKGKSRVEDIELGLSALVEEVKRLGIQSIAVPPLGCGSGGLSWSDVRPRIEAALAELPDVRALMFQPHGAPHPEAMPVSTKSPSMTRARAAIVRLIQQYGVPGYRLSLLEIQKLAYFLQEAGEDLKLEFVRSRYGPYAEKLNFPLQRIEGHFIRGYGDRSRDAQIFVLPGAVEIADRFLAKHLDTDARLQRVSQFIEGFETPYGMELLATVYWVAKEFDPPAQDQESAIAAVHGWSARKHRLFRPEHIRIAWNRLEDHHWLNRVTGKEL
jgi:O-acetyl-ADP-ribose deacetylase (regulator of RNase III)